MSTQQGSNRVDRAHDGLGDIVGSEGRVIELSMPAHPQLWSLPRMAVASVASKLGFDFEQIEDLRLGVDELTIACARGASSEARLMLSCSWSETGLYVECTVAPVGSKGGPLDEDDLPSGFSQQELSESILAALVDAHGILPVKQDSRTGWLRKTI